MKKVGLVLASMLAFVGTPVKGAYAVHDTIQVHHHAIHVDVRDFKGHVLKGKAELQVESKMNGIKYIPLQLLKLSVDSVWVNGALVENGVQYNDTLLRIPVGSTLQKGEKATVQVAYHGVPVVQRFGGFMFVEKDRMAHNMGVSINDIPHSYGKSWYPAVDDFRAKSYYDLYIQTDADLKGIGNGLLQETLPQTDGSVVWHWKLNQPIPDYLVNVAVGNYEQLHFEHRQADRTVPMDVYVLPQELENARGAYSILPEVMKVVDEKFGAFCFDRVGFVSVNSPGGAMEHATNISMPRNPQPTASYQELWIHELIHSWFGNRVTCETAEDMWLNEGMTTWAVEVVLEELFGKEQLHAYRQSTQNTALMAPMREGGYRALTNMPQEYTYSSTVYQKGAWVMRTLRNYLGDDLFFKGLKQYVKDYTYQTANTQQFQACMERVTGKNLEAFFQNLIHEPGFRVLVPELLGGKMKKGVYTGQVRLKQQQLGVEKTVPDTWQIPVAFYAQNGESAVVNVSFQWEEQETVSTVELPFKPVFALADPAQTLIKAQMLDTAGESRYVYAKASEGQAVVEYLMTPPSDADATCYWRVFTTTPAKSGATLSFTLNRMKDRALFQKANATVKIIWREDSSKPWQVLGTHTLDLKQRNLQVDAPLKSGEYVLSY